MWKYYVWKHSDRFTTPQICTFVTVWDHLPHQWNHNLLFFWLITSVKVKRTLFLQFCLFFSLKLKEQSWNQYCFEWELPMHHLILNAFLRSKGTITVSRMHLMEMLHRMSSTSQPSIKCTVQYTVLSNDLMCSKWVVNYETNTFCTARPWGSFPCFVGGRLFMDRSSSIRYPYMAHFLLVLLITPRSDANE